MRTAYRFRIYPTATQAQIMFRTIGSARKIYNLVLADRIDSYNNYKEGLITLDKFHESTRNYTPAFYKKEHEYLKEADSQALVQAVNHLDKSYKNFYRNVEQGRKPGYPKFKTRSKSKWSYTSCKVGNNIRLTEDGRGLVLPKVPGAVEIRCHRPIRGTIKRVTITRQRSGKWFVAILVETGKELPPSPVNTDGVLIDKKSYLDGSKAIGIDLGLIDLITGSDGMKTGNPRFSYQAASKLHREQRKLALKREHIKRICKKTGREVKYSEWSNYEKQRERVARINERIQDQRLDHLHRLSSTIINTHDIVTVETLKVQNLMKNKSLARSIQDAGWSTLISMLEYKAARAGKVFVKCGTFFPSSQLCSKCKSRGGKKSLGVREWTCDNCCAVLDRDINAAANILDEGLSVLGFTEGEVIKLLEPAGCRG